MIISTPSNLTPGLYRESPAPEPTEPLSSPSPNEVAPPSTTEPREENPASTPPEGFRYTMIPESEMASSNPPDNREDSYEHRATLHVGDGRSSQNSDITNASRHEARPEARYAVSIEPFTRVGSHTTISAPHPREAVRHPRSPQTPSQEVSTANNRYVAEFVETETAPALPSPSETDTFSTAIDHYRLRVYDVHDMSGTIPSRIRIEGADGFSQVINLEPGNATIYLELPEGDYEFVALAGERPEGEDGDHFDNFRVEIDKMMEETVDETPTEATTPETARGDDESSAPPLLS